MAELYTLELGRCLDDPASKRSKIDLENKSLEELVDIAESNGDLRNAYLEYKNRFGDKVVHIFCVEVNGRAVEINHREIKIQDLSLCKKLLNWFGLAVRKLKFTHGANQKADFVREIVKYINNNCSSVVEFAFKNCPKTFMAHLKQLNFRAVKTVHFDSCSFGKKVDSLRKWFPNVQQLKFSGVNCIYPKYVGHNCFGVELTKLEHLEISIPNAGKNAITTDNVVDILKMNTKLQSLSITGRVNFEFLQNLSEYLDDLKSLEIGWNEAFYNPYNSLERVYLHFKNVKKLKITFSVNNICIPLIPIMFDAIEEFSFDIDRYCRSSCNLGHDLTKFICAQKNLRKLHIGSYTTELYESHENACKTWNLSDKMKLAMPSLAEVDLRCCIFTFDEVIEFINKSPMLQKLSVGLGKREHDELNNHFNNKWHTTIDPNSDHITMERIN